MIAGGAARPSPRRQRAEAACAPAAQPAAQLLRQRRRARRLPRSDAAATLSRPCTAWTRSARSARPTRNFGPADGLPAARRDAAGAPACRRERHRPRRVSPAPARTAASSPRDVETRWQRATAPRSRHACAGARRAGQGALSRRRFEEVPLDGMRATIAARLIEAKQTIPHFYLTADVDDRRAVMTVRAEANAGAPKRRRGGLQAFGQRLRHQGAGAGAAARSRPPMRCWARRSHPALPARPISASRWRSTAG